MQSSDLLSKVPAWPVLPDFAKRKLCKINTSGQASARKFSPKISASRRPTAKRAERFGRPAVRREGL